MYCPQCSQQQISDEMHFCSRCGFQLTGVRELMAGGKVLPVHEDKLESRRVLALKGARSGVVLMLISLPIALVVTVLTASDDDFAVLFLLPVLMMLVGFIRTCYGIFCQSRSKELKSAAEKKVVSIPTFRTPENLNAGMPHIQLLQPSKQTAEVRQPASVTENTTRLLDEDA